MLLSFRVRTQDRENSNMKEIANSVERQGRKFASGEREFMQDGRERFQR